MKKARSSLHALLTAAAISLTVLSAVGVATLTGLIPSPPGLSKAAKPAQAATVKPVRKSAPRSAPPRAADPQVVAA